MTQASHFVNLGLSDVSTPEPAKRCLFVFHSVFHHYLCSLSQRQSRWPSAKASFSRATDLGSRLR